MTPSPKNPAMAMALWGVVFMVIATVPLLSLNPDLDSVFPSTVNLVISLVLVGLGAGLVGVASFRYAADIRVAYVFLSGWALMFILFLTTLKNPDAYLGVLGSILGSVVVAFAASQGAFARHPPCCAAVVSGEEDE